MKYEYIMPGSCLPIRCRSLREAKRLVTALCRLRGECDCRLRWISGDKGEVYAIGSTGFARGRQVAMIQPLD
jgi:hypothetical protein